MTSFASYAAVGMMCEVATTQLRVMRVIARMNVGGPALQVSGLVQELSSERFDQRLYTGTVATGEADYIRLRATGLPHTVVEGLGRSPRPLDDLRAFFELVRMMRSFKPHIVHTHTAKAGVLGRLAAFATGVPVVVHTFHGHLLNGYFSQSVTRAVTAVERVLARWTTALVSVGAQVRDDLLAAGIGHAEQYVVVPPGIALSALPRRDEARTALGLPPDAVVVVLVARLTSIKRPERFIAVARMLQESHPSAVFAVVGEGDLLADLRSDAPSNVCFLGWRGDIERVYAAADLAVLTSDNEGMPVSLIEAALCGVPAVSTRVGSVAEVVLDGRSGWLCEPDGLAASVSEALSDPVRLAAFGTAAREHAEASFSLARLVADTERLYEQAATETGL